MLQLAGGLDLVVVAVVGTVSDRVGVVVVEVVVVECGIVVVGVEVIGIGGRLVSLHNCRSHQCLAHPARSCASCVSSSKELVCGASMQIFPARPISNCARTATFTRLGPGSRSMT